MRKSKYEDGGLTFIAYKDNEIMYEPTFNKYYANDVEFGSLEDAKKFLDSGEISSHIKGAYSRGLFEKGGDIAQGNYEMMLSQAKEIKHHNTELQNILKSEKEIDAWVVAKMENASSTLSDITHYLDGKTEYAEGGEIDEEKLTKIQESILKRIKKSPTKSMKDHNLSNYAKMALNDLYFMGLVKKEYINGTQNAEYTLIRQENKKSGAVGKKEERVIFNLDTYKIRFKGVEKKVESWWEYKGDYGTRMGYTFNGKNFRTVNSLKEYYKNFVEQGKFAQGGEVDEIKVGDYFKTSEGEIFYIEKINKQDKNYPYFVTKSNPKDLGEVISAIEFHRYLKNGFFEKVDGKFAKGGQTASIGDSGIITDKNSIFMGKMALVTGDLGNMYEVNVGGKTTIVKKSGLDIIHEEDDYYAKGGMVVTKIKDIPNFQQRLDEGRITYRGLGMGKKANDFYKLTGTSGTSIKVDGKEYNITDEEFATFSRGSDGKMRIRFSAPARKGYAKGGEIEDNNQYDFSIRIYKDNLDILNDNPDYEDFRGTKKDVLKKVNDSLKKEEILYAYVWIENIVTDWYHESGDLERMRMQLNRYGEHEYAKGGEVGEEKYYYFEVSYAHAPRNKQKLSERTWRGVWAKSEKEAIRYVKESIRQEYKNERPPHTFDKIYPNLLNVLTLKEYVAQEARYYKEQQERMNPKEYAKGGTLEVEGDSLDEIKKQAKLISKNWKKNTYVLETTSRNFISNSKTREYSWGDDEDVDGIKSITHDMRQNITILMRYNNGNLMSAEEEIIYKSPSLQNSDESKYAKGGVVRNNKFQSNLEELLKQEGFQVSYYDNNVNEMPKEKAEVISLTKWSPYYENFSLKLPSKMEVTFEWIMNKLSNDKVYKSFAENFNKILKAKGYSNLNAYPTSYGIGVFVGFGRGIEETKTQIEELLNSLGIDYKTEYSEGGWVFRYRISKSKENIAKINQIEMTYARGGEVNNTLDKTEKYWYERIKNSHSKSVSTYNLSTNNIIILNRLSSMGLVDKQVIKGTQEATYTLKEKLAKGGKIGFEGLSNKVAKRYVGKKVSKEYQAEYGKTYDAKEAKEVGNKVAGKVYQQQVGKKKIVRKLQRKTN